MKRNCSNQQGKDFSSTYCSKMFKTWTEDKDDEVTMSKEDFIKEHENLIKILKKGDRKELLKEAEKQEKELEEYEEEDDE